MEKLIKLTVIVLMLREVTEEKDLGVIISKDLEVFQQCSVQQRAVKHIECWEISTGQLLKNLLTLCYDHGRL